MKEIPVIVVSGPTASGKTAFAVRLAEALNGEIISVDSRQIFRGMDLGTGKDLEEYTLPSGKVIPTHLIDIADPDYPYNLAEFMRDCHKAIREIASRGRQVILCGGTALYLDSILRSYTLQGGAPDAQERLRKRSMSTADLQKMLFQLEPESPILKNEPDNRTRIIRRIEQLQCSPDQALLESANHPAGDLRYRFLVLGTLRSRQSAGSFMADIAVMGHRGGPQQQNGPSASEILADDSRAVPCLFRFDPADRLSTPLSIQRLETAMFFSLRPQ